jgi:hypothetical protein
MLTWTPNPRVSPWAEVQEDEVWAEPVITALDDSIPPLDVTGYTAEVIGDPLLGLVVASGSSGVMVSAPVSLVGSFPAIDIEYQIKGVTGHCLRWPDLPVNADEVIKYQPNPVSTKIWMLRVTASLSDGTTSSADFDLKVYANFTPGCTALKEAVNARRH